MWQFLGCQGGRKLAIVSEVVCEVLACFTSLTIMAVYSSPAVVPSSIDSVHVFCCERSYPFEIHDDALVLKKMLENENMQQMAAQVAAAPAGELCILQAVSSICSLKHAIDSWCRNTSIKQGCGCCKCWLNVMTAVHQQHVGHGE